MENLFSVFRTVSLFLFVVLFSCESDRDIYESNAESESISVSSNSPTASKWYIYYATFDEWGRASRDCDGWGLCNYRDCWGCWVNDKGTIVDPDNPNSTLNYGTVAIDDSTNLGTMTIELDPNISIQNDAILYQETLYVDEDIVNKNSILYKGDYLFDSNVGSHGGYTLNMKQLK